MLRQAVVRKCCTGAVRLLTHFALEVAGNLRGQPSVPALSAFEQAGFQLGFHLLALGGQLGDSHAECEVLHTESLAFTFEPVRRQGKKPRAEQGFEGRHGGVRHICKFHSAPRFRRICICLRIRLAQKERGTLGSWKSALEGE